MTKINSSFSILTLLILLLALLPSRAVYAQIVTPEPFQNTQYDNQAYQIANELQCPVCQGVTVAYSNSGLAQQIRVLIKKKLEQGESREQILGYFVERYGESILTNPPKNGFTLLVWLLPIAGFLIGAGVVGYVLRLWRGRLKQVAHKSALIQPNFSSEASDTQALVSSQSQIDLGLTPQTIKAYEDRIELELAQLNGTAHDKGIKNASTNTSSALPSDRLQAQLEKE